MRRKNRSNRGLSALLGSVLSLSGLADAVARTSAEADLEARFATVVSAVPPVAGHGCRSQGSGFYIGDGLFLTAAHVLLDRADLMRDCRFTATARAALDRRAETFAVLVAPAHGAFGKAAVVAAGHRVLSPIHTMSFAASADYAIIRADGAKQDVLGPCAAPAMPMQPVLVVLRNEVARTRVAAAQTAKSGDDAAYVDLDIVLEHGASGAAVLDATTFCVLGIISHRFPEPRPSVTRMTSAAVFAEPLRRARSR